MVRYVRVVANPTLDYPDKKPLYFDLIVNSDNEIVGDHPIFGFHGDIDSKSGYSYPFVLHDDGRASFGQDCEDEWNRIDLRTGKIVEGRLFCYSGSGFNVSYRIAIVRPLAEATEI